MMKKQVVLWLCFLGVLSLFSGCSTTKVFQADRLPRNLHAPSLVNAKTLDLTKMATASSTTDLVGTGDVLEVSISAGLSSDDTATFPVRVAEGGIASLPIVGAVNLDGVNLEEAEAIIVRTCVDKGLYHSPHVTVSMKQPKVHRITVLGAVAEPGTYELRANQSDVLQAIVAAGSLSEDAGTFVQVRQPGKAGPTSQNKSLIASHLNDSGSDNSSFSGKIEQTSGDLKVHTSGGTSVRINLASAAIDKPNSLKLEDGGVVMVERRDPKPIHVLGLVAKPDRYEFPISEDLRLLDAIALASGTDNPFADKVYIIRNNPTGGEPVLIEGSIHKAKRNGKADLRLAPGDIVTVERTPSTTFFETISMIGFGLSARAF